MKKTYLKLIASLLLLLGTTAFVACSNDDDIDETETVIGFNELPMAAQTFLNTHFKGIDAYKIEKVTQVNVVLYDVELVNGFGIVFNSSGEWQEVDAPDGQTVPMAIIPEPIQATLNEQYPGYGVVEINTTGQNYHVELSNNQGGSSIDLIFNQSGEIIATVDM